MSEERFFIRGEVDAADAPELRAQLSSAIEAGDGDLVVDCFDLTFIGGAGIRVLVAAHLEISEGARKLRIENLSPSVQRVFDLLDLDFSASSVPAFSEERTEDVRIAT